MRYITVLKSNGMSDILDDVTRSEPVNLLRNVLALIGGFIIGAIVNMGLIEFGHNRVPVPEEFMQIKTIEALKEASALLSPKHFVFPFIAHALGTLVGAYVCSRIAYSRKRELALVIGFIFLSGGVSMIITKGGPHWFKIADLGFAYIPMAILGWSIAVRTSSK